MVNFSAAPDWEWLVIAYLFTGGMAGGMFVMGTVLRVLGPPEDRPAARVAFWAALPLIAICPIFLIAHIGEPTRFWHMLINTSDGSPTFLKFWSPMPVGAWALLLFGGCAFLIFVNQIGLVPRSRLATATLEAGAGAGGGPGFGSPRRAILPQWLEYTVLALGFATGVFLMGYTGVLLSASNQPVWSDTWALGGLFVASSLATATAVLSVILWLSRQNSILERLGEAIFYFVILELILFAITSLTLGDAGSHFKGGAGVAHDVSLGLEILAALLLVPITFRTFIRSISPTLRVQLMMLAAVLIVVAGFLLRTAIVFAPTT